MPQPEDTAKVTELADELLSALRSAAHAIVTGDEDPALATAVSDSTSRFTAAATKSPDLAKAVEASPGIAALSIASKDLAKLADRSPELAELAVVSPNLAVLAEKAPELAELAKASPALASNIEQALSRLSK